MRENESVILLEIIYDGWIVDTFPNNMRIKRVIQLRR